MKGIVIWSQSNCRSTMALYREWLRLLDAPALITLWYYHKCADEKDIRERIGFSHDEFSDLPMMPVGEDLSKGLSVIESHVGWHHVFCVWQRSPVYRRLALEAKRRGCPVAVMCESPCNMSSGWRRPVKSAYLRLALPALARKVVNAADVFVNCSGDDPSAALRLGWEADKIIPFGYFSPPIPNSRCVPRESPDRFHVLATGVLSRYRGADVLVEALRLLKSRGVPCRATVTQGGELLPSLREKSSRFGLPIEFSGFVEMPDLIRLYETCSVFVGAGRSEPWGMRLNDALQCGAPLVVSRGMGGVQLIDRYRCGLDFPAGDAGRLADALEQLSTDRALYRQVSENAVVAAEKTSPAEKAKELIHLLKEKNWL